MPSTYTIQRGDTLWGLAQKYGGGGSNWGQINAVNGGSLNPSDLQVGKSINMPSHWNVNGTSSNTPVAPASTPSSTPSTGTSTDPSNSGFDLNSIEKNVNTQLQPDINKAQQSNDQGNSNILQAAQNSQNNLNTLQGTIQTNSNNQLSQNKAALDTQIGAIQDFGKFQAGLLNTEEQGQKSAIAAENAANGMGGDPFTEAEQTAVGQPYEQALTGLNLATQKEIGTAVATMMGINSTLTGMTDSQISQIGIEASKLMPDATAQIAQNNIQISGIIQQYKIGAITQSAAIAGIQEKWNENQNNLQLGYSQIQAGIQNTQTSTQATVQAAGIAANAPQVHTVQGAGGMQYITDQYGNITGYTDAAGNYFAFAKKSDGTYSTTPTILSTAAATANNVSGAKNNVIQSAGGTKVINSPSNSLQGSSSNIQGSQIDLQNILKTNGVPIQ